jgi:membrane protein YdbS with pleckstrin-like domain
MLTKEESNFIEYWEQNRLHKKQVWRQLSIGLPLAVLLVTAIFVNFFSGWYKRAEMTMNREDSSLVLILLVAALLIVVFVVVFSVRHKWDMHEQRYRELLAKKGPK